MTYTKFINSPLGRIKLESDGKNLTGLHFSDEGEENGGPEVFDETLRWLDIYFSGGQCDFTLPLSPVGTKFQRYVWELLLKIPYGETRTYGELAASLGYHGGFSARAVGGAVGKNPIAIIIPCHRVVGVKGLTGYAGGLDKKKKLLAIEGIFI